MDVSLTNSDLPLTLSLKDKPKKSLTCGETFKPKIYFASSRDLKLDLNYIAFSKGRIVASDTIKVITRSKEDSLSSLYQIGNAIELGAYEKVSFKVHNYVFLIYFFRTIKISKFPKIKSSMRS